MDIFREQPESDAGRGAGTAYTRIGDKANRYLYNGKELQDDLDLNWYDYGARMYLPELGRWGVVDALSEKKIWESPYDYVINNPILRFDPNGLTDFKMNKETGVVNQVGDPNDDRDRILKTDKNGNVKKRGDGLFGFMGKKENKDKPRIAIKDIAKGILSDGMNLKTDSHVIDVNGNGQPTTNEVERFTFEVSNYVNTEISGYLLSDQGSTSTNHVYINGYINNDDQNCNNNGFMLRSVRPDLFNRINRNMTYFHTHLSVFNDDARLNASRADLTFKEDQLNNGVNRFLIITNPEPLEHEYQ